MISLGICAFYHDSAVAILQDDKIIFALQEERLSRKKADSNFPTLAIKASLNYLNQQLIQKPIRERERATYFLN